MYIITFYGLQIIRLYVKQNMDIGNNQSINNTYFWAGYSDIYFTKLLPNALIFRVFSNWPLNILFKIL